MTGLIERSLLLGLGVLTLTRDKVNQFVEKLVEEGEVQAEEAPSVVDRLVARGEAEREEMRRLIQEELDKVRAGVPMASRRDIEELGQKLDDLAARIDDLAGKKPAKKQSD